MKSLSPSSSKYSRVFLPGSRARTTRCLCCILNKFRRYQSFGEFARFHPHWHSLTSWLPICFQDEFSWYAVMGYMPEKSASSGRSVQVFTAWPRKAGKKAIRTNPKLCEYRRLRMWKRSKSLMPAQGYASKVGSDYCKKVYEVDPFVCLKCQGTMTVVAIIEDTKEFTKIIDWARQQLREPRLTVCARSPPEPELVSV